MMQSSVALAAPEGQAIQHDLPAGMEEWLCAIGGGGRIMRLERAIARREAWLVDIARPDGSTLEGFLRLDRSPRDDDPWSLAKEVAIVRALGNSPVPVAAVLGDSDTLHCVLFERLTGRSDLHNMPPAQQRAVMLNFMDVVAQLHALPLDLAGLPAMPMPADARECALGEVDLVLAHWAEFLSTYRDPLLTYGVDWLRRFAPSRVDRVSLLQGDTGPMNFMFEGDRVSAVFDWEWGHLGDPMEDLGNISVREFWNPSGGLTGLLERYEQASGRKVDRAAVLYYRVQQQIRGMVPNRYYTVHAKPHEPIAWYLAYRYVGDRATCEAIAEAMGIVVEPPEYPPENDMEDPLAKAASWALHNDIKPGANTPLAISRIAEVDVLLRCMARVAKYGALIDETERREIGALLGDDVATLEEGLTALDEAITAHRLSDEAVITYLARRCFRGEWLYQPSTTLFPKRRWSSL